MLVASCIVKFSFVFLAFGRDAGITYLLVSVQEFLHNNAPSKKPDGNAVKTKSQNRGRVAATRSSTRRCRMSAKTKSMDVTACEPATSGLNRITSECGIDSRRKQPSMPLSGSDGDVDIQTLTSYTDRMKEFIAQSLIEDRDDDDSRALGVVYSPSPPQSQSSHSLYNCVVKLDKVSKLQSDHPCHAFPRTTVITPARHEADVQARSPPAKRRLFGEGLCLRRDTQHAADSSGGVHALEQLGRQNGYHSVQKLLTTSMNGTSLGVVDHYEDGLLAIANAACLMSTGVFDGRDAGTKVSDHQGI